MIINPIIAREVRVRWRGRGSALLVLILVAGLALAMGAAYFSEVDPADEKGTQSAGRTIFMVLSYMQVAAWLILSPTLTSMGLAAERERGLLEGLQLSPLRPYQIIGGKFFAAVAFIVLLSLCSLPITGLTFMLGGVSPAEFLLATGLNLLTALTGAGIGMFFSASCLRPLKALLLSLTAVAVWFFGTIPLLIFSQGGFGALRGTPAVTVWTELAGWAVFFNPMISLYFLFEPLQLAGVGLRFPGPPGFQYWTVFPYFAAVVSSLALWGATRAVRKPYAPAARSDRHWHSFGGSATRSNPTTATAEAAQALPAAAGSPAAAAESPVEARLLREVRLDRWVNFKNPILRREVRGALRWRQASAWKGILQLLAAAGAGSAWCLLFIYLLNKPSSRHDAHSLIVNAWLFAAILAAAIWSARSIARDRENGFAEGLEVSLLTNAEVMRARLLAPLLVIGLYSMPVVTMLIVTIGHWPQAEPGNEYFIPVWPMDVLGPVLLVGATVLFVSAIGLFVSNRCARVTNAVVTTLVTLLVLWAVCPVFLDPVLDLLFPSTPLARSGASELILRVTNPFAALNSLGMSGGRNQYRPNIQSFLYIASAVLGATLLCTQLLMDMDARKNRR